MRKDQFYQWRDSIVRSFKKGELTETKAAELLQCTMRHLYRLVHVLDDRGTTAPLPCVPWNHLNAQVEDAIVRTFKAGTHRNNQHIADLIAEEGTVTNRETVRQVLARHNLRRTHQRIPEPAQRFEHPEIGAVVYQDTSTHRWVRGIKRKIKLIANLDDHSRKILRARFFFHDGVWQNMATIRGMIEGNGLPDTFFTDRAALFSSNEKQYRANPGKARAEDEVQIHRAVESLGIHFSRSRAYHPQSKGKMERFFRFAQERLQREINTDTLETSNTILDRWIRWYNMKHVNEETRQTPETRWQEALKDGRSKFLPLPAMVNLDDVFSFHDTRFVEKDNTFSYGGVRYLIEGCGGELIGKTVELHILPGYALRVWYKGQHRVTIPFQGAFRCPID